ncbi:MAG: tetratricopeptide repeat protein [Planctomycetota bacterium]
MPLLAGILIILAFLAPGCRDDADSPAPPPEGESQTEAGIQPAEEPASTPNPVAVELAQDLEGARQRLTNAENWRALAELMLTTWEKTLQGLASDPKLHLSAGRAAMERGDVSAALRRFRRATRLAPQDADTWRHLALAQTAADEHSGSVESYRRVLELSPQDRTARYNLAVALSRLGRLGEAERAYSLLVADHPDFVEGRYNLAVLLQSRGRRGEALKHWRKVAERKPDLASAHAAIGELLTDLGRDAEAMDAFARAAKCGPESPTAWANLAFSAESAGSFGRAVVAARRAREAAERSEKPHAELLVQLGDLLLRTHRRLEDAELLAEAVACWRESLSENADQPELRRRVELYRSVTTRPSADAGE